MQAYTFTYRRKVVTVAAVVATDEAVVDITLRPRCCPLVSHFEYTHLCLADYGQTRRRALC